MNVANIVDQSKQSTEAIVKAYLVEHGFDGLYYPSECGCELDDLMPCGEGYEDCEPGYKCPCDCGEGCEWHIGPKMEGKSDD